MAEETEGRRVARYVREKTRRYVLQCNLEKDADVIEELEAVGNVNAYLKKAVRRMREDGKGNRRRA